MASTANPMGIRTMPHNSHNQPFFAKIADKAGSAQDHTFKTAES